MPKHPLRTLLLALAALHAVLLPAAAEAAPAELYVRVEGRVQTLFEGPLRSDGHYLQSSSDNVVRRCDGTNAGANPSPGPTPTAAAWDAMALLGQGFDGRWYAGYDDYFVQQWGPDRESYDTYAFWGILVDGSFLSVGGCQYRTTAGDEVLWAYDAFNARPFLRLAAADDPAAAPTPASPVAYVGLDQPLRVRVQRYSGAMDGGAQNVAAVAGVPVAPVEADPATGFETVATAAGTPTGGDGTVELSFATPGWHRLKAARDADYVRSNRLDVCVRPGPGQDCGPLPATAQVRQYPGPFPEPPARPGGGGGTGAAAGGGAAAKGGDGNGACVRGAATSGCEKRGAARLGRLRMAPRRGTATLAIHLAGPGWLRLFGAGLRPRTVSVARARTVRLTVAPRPGARKQLRKRGRLAVVAKLRIAGPGGPQLLRRRLVLRWVPSS